MSYPAKVRKEFRNNIKNSSSNSSKNSKSSSNNSSNSSSKGSSAIRSKQGSICGKKPDQILSSTLNSSAGSSTTGLICDISDIEKADIKKKDQCPKDKDKKAKMAVLKTKVMPFAERAKEANAAYIQKLCFSNFLAERNRHEAEICFSEPEDENLKLINEISNIKQRLKEVDFFQENEARIEQLEHKYMEEEDNINQLLTSLTKVYVYMKAANGQVPLTALKVTDASRDKFLSATETLSNVHNELDSIVKPHEDIHKCAAQNLEACLSTDMSMRSQIKDMCSVMPSVVSNSFKVLSLRSCLMHQEHDLQQNKIGFHQEIAGLSSETASDRKGLLTEDVKLLD